MGACMAAMVIAAITIAVREIMLMPEILACDSERIRSRVIPSGSPRRIAHQCEQEKAEGQEAFWRHGAVMGCMSIEYKGWRPVCQAKRKRPVICISFLINGIKQGVQDSTEKTVISGFLPCCRYQHRVNAGVYSCYISQKVSVSGHCL